MSRQLTQLRNIGIIAHIDAGKTTVTERMLFHSGAKHRVGEVDKGTTETDADPEEQERGITIYSACVTFPWKDVVINLLDTPGHVDFTAEVERCLRVLDGAVVVFSAREGVEAQSETVWRQANKYGVSRIAFINKMDREGANFEGTVQEMRRRLGAHPLVLQIPMGQGPAHGREPFIGVIDLVRMKQLKFDSAQGGAQGGQSVQESSIPAEWQDAADAWREEMLDSLYQFSDEMMELAVQEQPIPEALIRRVIRDATLHQQIQPVLCGSALHGVGVQPILDAVAAYLPSPADMPAVKGADPRHPDRSLSRSADPREPFCGLVFKILPAKTGDVYWIRIYSGELHANSRAYNPRLDQKENVAQLWQIHVTQRVREGQMPVAQAGDIVAVIGPRHSITGDTLCDAKQSLLLESIEFPETVMSMAIEPESSLERKKLAETLEMMKRQDPTFRAEESEETGQTLISGMGELHLEVIKHRLLRDFKLNAKVHKPRVSYRETIEKSVEVTGECHRQIAGQQLFASLTVRLEPVADGVGMSVQNRAAGDALPVEFLQAAIEELRALTVGGGLIGGFPLARIRVTILGGEASIELSNETAFRIAAAEAFEQGLRQGGPVLLEPVMKLSITTPEEYVGDFVADIQQRRGVVVDTEFRGSVASVEAQVPLAELFGYSGAMRSLSQGRAGCSMEPLHYAPAPPQVAAQFGQ